MTICHRTGSGKYIKITVDDDGAGVPEGDRQHIFLLGVSHREGGTGLGLALARKVAEAHGGTLDVGDSPLGGARFTLSIPLEPRPEAP